MWGYWHPPFHILQGDKYCPVYTTDIYDFDLQINPFRPRRPGNAEPKETTQNMQNLNRLMLALIF